MYILCDWAEFLTNGFHGSFCAWAQPMRDNVAMKRRHSLAWRIHRMIPGFLIPPFVVITWNRQQKMSCFPGIEGYYPCLPILDAGRLGEAWPQLAIPGNTRPESLRLPIVWMVSTVPTTIQAGMTACLPIFIHIQFSTVITQFSSKYSQKTPHSLSRGSSISTVITTLLDLIVYHIEPCYNATWMYLYGNYLPCNTWIRLQKMSDLLCSTRPGQWVLTVNNAKSHPNPPKMNT